MIVGNILIRNMRDSLNDFTVYMAQQRERIQNEMNTAAVGAPVAPLTVHFLKYLLIKYFTLVYR